MKKTKKNKIEGYKNEINARYKIYEALFNKDEIKEADIKDKINEINSLIEHVNNRIYYTETRLGRAVTFSITLIAVGIAFFASIIELNGLSFYLGIVSSGMLIITGITCVLINAFQTNPRYPFRKLTNDWKWFYPGIVESNYKPNLLMKESDEKYFNKRLMHIKGLNKYAEKVMLETSIERVKIDIQQLYLLHVNEKYKNKFLNTLRSVLRIGITISLTAIIILFAVMTIEKIHKDYTQKQTEKVLVDSRNENNVDR